MLAMSGAPPAQLIYAYRRVWIQHRKAGHHLRQTLLCGPSLSIIFFSAKAYFIKKSMNEMNS